MKTESRFATPRRLVFSAVFLALALALPFLTGQIPEIGAMLCPMHIPVLLCGFVCGWPWGILVGAVAPLMRSLLFGMPPIYPAAVCMAFELATYGGVSGILHARFPRKKGFLYGALVLAMIAGRIVWGAAQFICVGLQPSRFGFEAFWSGAVVTAIPGIIVQIVLIPVLVLTLERTKPAACGSCVEK